MVKGSQVKVQCLPQTDEQVLAAFEDVKKGVSQKHAVDTHGVPRSTFKDHINGKVLHGTRPGPVSYLTTEEETLLAEYLLI